MMITFSIDRSTPVGKVIDSYLKQTEKLHDKAVHLLFSANRWELEYVHSFTLDLSYKQSRGDSN